MFSFNDLVFSPCGFRNRKTHQLAYLHCRGRECLIVGIRHYSDGNAIVAIRGGFAFLARPDADGDYTELRRVA
jgi:hypothetical protein